MYRHEIAYKTKQQHVKETRMQKEHKRLLFEKKTSLLSFLMA